jgi:acetyl-CoA acetyltransferase family protein
MRQAVIVEAVRTARGKRNGSLSRVHPMDLLAHTLKGLVERARIDPLEIDDVVVGCVTQVGEQGLNIGRGAVLAAGLPLEVAGNTVNRFCGSGLQALNYAAQAVISGAADVVVAGGVEHMTRVPMGSDAFSPSGGSPMSPRLLERFPNLVPQGLSAEMIAEKFKLSRRELDEFSVQSQRKAATAIEQGRFRAEILPIEVEDENGNRKVFEQEEHPRPGTTVEVLAGLKPSFKPDGVIHAGNSSGIVDGAAALLVTTPEKARALGLRPRLRFVSMAVAGDDPVLMLLGPLPSTRKALKKANLDIRDVDLYEVNEAFAPVPLAVGRELGMDFEKMNVNGGAIALGHPLGATGAILTATLMNELERQDKRLGLVTMCIGYGMGITTIFERVS